MTYILSDLEAQSVRKAARDDRRWFARNPKRTHRIRRAVRGEFGPHLPPAPDGWVHLTVVRQHVPGLRIRLPFAVHRFDTWPRDEAAVHALFDLIMEAHRAGEASTIRADYVEQLAAGYEVGGGVQ